MQTKRVENTVGKRKKITLRAISPFPTVYSKDTEKPGLIQPSPRKPTGLAFPERQILDSSKLIEFADDNFKFNGNGAKFSKQIEYSVEKGVIAR